MAPGECARIVALDLLLGNEDRHRDNLLLARLDTSGIRIVAIDHEQAWAGRSGAILTDQLPDLDKYPEDFSEHVDVAMHLTTAAADVSREPSDRWRAIAADVAQFVPGTDAIGLAKGLEHRARLLPELAAAFIRGHKVRV